MKSRPELPIEPLRPAAWQRVKDRVFVELDLEGSGPCTPAKPSGQRAAIGALLMAGAALAMVLAFWFVGHEPKRALEPITTSRIVATETRTRVMVGDAALEAAPESALVTTGSEAIGWIVVLEQGKVAFAVPNRAERPPFRVQAGEVSIQVIGTRFTVTRKADAVTVNVERGVVRVNYRDQALRLSPGERWKTPGVQPKIEAPVAEAPIAEAPVAEAPVAKKAAADEPPSAQDTARARYEAASKLEATDPSAALALYSELSQKSGAGAAGTWAANALYAAGRLEFERGRTAQAKRLLQQYEQRFPKGPNAREARSLLMQLH